MRLANDQDQAIIRSAIADSSASTLAFLSSMGQREAIAFGEGVATTMRLKFQKVDRARIPGAGNRSDSLPAESNGEDVDLISIVEHLRNVPRSQTNVAAFAEPVSPQLQPGDPGYRKHEAVVARPNISAEQLDVSYGLKPGLFGSRLK